MEKKKKQNLLPSIFYNNMQRNVCMGMASPNLPSNCCYFKNGSGNINKKKNRVLHRFCYAKWGNQSRNGSFPSRVSSSSALLILSLRDRRRSWRFYANAELPLLVDGSSKISHTNAQSPIIPSVEIPVTCYQILGVHAQAEKDELVKSVMHLRNAQIEEGYTADVVVSRKNILMDARDKLLFEPEYAGNIKEKIPPKSSLQIPWAWFPGALCLLQEAGEDKIVLDIGQKALQHSDAKLYVHDILLCMALAECEIAKNSFMKNNISQGFEALARAQCLLRSKISLGKMTLLSQIEESLEELAPACTLELLAMPHTPENAERRLGAVSALRELLRQGIDMESSCQVQDWPCFLNQALNKLLATEIVELLPWDELALIRKNKKSLESQNQRVVIDFNCFYKVLIAHIAVGFSSKQIDLIKKGKTICECLITSEGIDLKFEEAFCLYLLGQGHKEIAAEKLRELDLSPDTASRSPVSVNEAKDVSNTKELLETWLRNSVFCVFPDTRDCSPSLVNFFAGEKQTSGNKQGKRSPHAMSSTTRRSLSLALDQKTYEGTILGKEMLQHLGPAVKQLTPHNLQGSLIEDKASGGTNISTPIQLKRNLGSHQNKVWGTWLDMESVVRKLIYLTTLGCIFYASFRLINGQFWRIGNAYSLRFDKLSTSSYSPDLAVYQNLIPARRNRFISSMKKLLGMLDIQIRRQSEMPNSQNSFLSTGLSSSGKRKRLPMPVEEAETLVKKWQGIKAEALGPNHHARRLFDILGESMLGQWQALADAAETSSCFWRFVLLQLSVLRAEIIVDENGKELAEIEAILEEAAELVDESQPKNPNYYSTYKIHYYLKKHDDGSWRFCEADIQPPS